MLFYVGKIHLSTYSKLFMGTLLNLILYLGEEWGSSRRAGHAGVRDGVGVCW